VFVLAPIRAIHGASESPLFGELLKKAQQEGAVVWWDSADDSKRSLTFGLSMKDGRGLQSNSGL